MLVTLSGIVIDVNLKQPENAPYPILVTLSGIVVFLHPAIKTLSEDLIMALQLFRES